MHILHLNTLRHIQIHMREIPDGLNAGRHQLLCHRHSGCLGNRQHCNLDVIILHKLLQFLHRANGDSADHLAHQIGILIEDSPEEEPPPFKIHIVAKCLSQITCPNDDEAMGLVQT